VLEFFTTQINNDHTRKAYLSAARRFAEWCERAGYTNSKPLKPFHVAAFIKELQGEFSPPTIKQHLAALRMLFDWLVIGHVLDVNPAHAVRGPKHVVKKGKTPVLTAEEARELLDSIALTRNTGGKNKPQGKGSALLGLRDRALIGVMVYTFARINAVLQMKVSDYFVQGRHGWVRLHEKGGKQHEVPCRHNLEQYLDEYIAAAGITGDPDGPLFRTAAARPAS
jgi:site-specific recombinase XerD